MNAEALSKVIEYAEDQNIGVQLTHSNGNWTADFTNDIHARVCYEALKQDYGLDVHLVKQDPLRILRIV